MIAALVRKELRQHGLYLVGVTVLVAIAGALSAALAFKKDPSLNAFEVLHDPLRQLTVAFSIVLAGRLVWKEYAEKTQLFLEGLPVSRVTMLATKFCLGLAYVLACATGALLVAVLKERANPLVSPRFLSILTLKAFGFGAFVYSFFFLVGLLGRYRWPIFLSLIAFGVYLDDRTNFELARFGPFSLINNTFAVERHAVPVADLLWSLLLTIIFFAVALLLAATREGSVAALLAEKMSRREKVLVVLAILFGATALFDTGKKKPKEPFDLKSAAVTTGDGVTVKVKDSWSGGERDGVVSRELHRQLAEVAATLGIASLPPVYVVRRIDLDAHAVEAIALDDDEGVLLRANYSAPAFERRILFGAAIKEALAVRSKRRVLLEENRWVVDGLANYLMLSISYTRRVSTQRTRRRSYPAKS